MDFFSDIDWLALFSCFKLWLQPAKSLQIKKKKSISGSDFALAFCSIFNSFQVKKDLFDLAI